MFSPISFLNSFLNLSLSSSVLCVVASGFISPRFYLLSRLYSPFILSFSLFPFQSHCSFPSTRPFMLVPLYLWFPSSFLSCSFFPCVLLPFPLSPPSLTFPHSTSFLYSLTLPFSMSSTFTQAHYDNMLCCGLLFYPILLFSFSFSCSLWNMYLFLLCIVRH